MPERCSAVEGGWRIESGRGTNARRPPKKRQWERTLKEHGLGRTTGKFNAIHSSAPLVQFQSTAAETNYRSPLPSPSLQTFSSRTTVPNSGPVDESARASPCNGAPGGIRWSQPTFRQFCLSEHPRSSMASNRLPINSRASARRNSPSEILFKVFIPDGKRLGSHAVARDRNLLLGQGAGKSLSSPTHKRGWFRTRRLLPAPSQSYL